MTISSNEHPIPPNQRWEWLHERLRLGGHILLQEYIETHGISLRTARNDFAGMRAQWGAPLLYDASRRGWHYSDLTFEPNRLYFTPDEAALLRRVLTAGRADLDTSEQPELDQLMTRITRHSRRVKPTPLVSADPGVIYQTPFNTIWYDCENAVNEQIPMEIEYYGPHRDAVTQRIVEPALVRKNGAEWFMIAFCRLRQEMRTFHLGRISQYRLLSGEPPFPRQLESVISAEYQDGLQMMVKGELEKVVVRFSAYQARWIIERKYHASQQVEKLEDGRLLFTIWVRGLPAIQRWVSQFGEHAEVLEPPALRDAIIESAKKILQEYSRCATKPAHYNDTISPEG